MTEEITKPKLLLVEGKDDKFLFEALLSELNLTKDCQVMEVGGETNFKSKLKALPDISGYKALVKSIGIVRDADTCPEAKFQSIQSILRNLDMPVPLAPMQPVEGPPQVVVMIVPGSDRQGMIENICLDSVSDDPAMPCVDEYFRCLESHFKILAENVVPKARVRAFLASREWLEIAHFEYLQRCMENYEPYIPESPTIAVPKVHTFLASRYTPNLDLGIAAQKTDDRYWRFDHPAFDNVKQFLRLL